ncbi:MAG: adenylate/guanylate cyclase domain-containing protein, partial [bacterium]|nr:adenylate/guanylate cyclase domain-containing protein [bacterium]
MSKFLAGESRLFGCLLFLDISGFTALTEKYMSEGHQGAEKVSDVLNSVFNPIIKKIYDSGGVVAVFAGDAISAVFKTKKIEEALLCAKEIINSTDGKIIPEVRIKTAVISGEIQVLSYESRKRKILFFDGKPFRMLKKVQTKLKPGEVIAADAETNRILKRSVILNAKRRKLQRRVAKNSFVEFSKPIKAKAEYRSVTSLFIDFSAAGQKSAEFISDAIRLCEKYNANFNMADSGDKGRIIFILFGAPVSHEDDVKRSVELLSELEKMHPKRFKAGVTRGMAFTGVIGSRKRSTYTAIGDNVNSAARIMSKALKGKVLVSEEVFRSLSEFYLFEYAGTMELKGKTKKVHTYTLGESVKKSDKIYETRFVGRSEYLKIGEEHMNHILNKKNGGILLVSGEAGSGKSRLISEICGRFSEKISKYELTADEVNKKSLFPFIGFVRRFFNADELDKDRELSKNFDKKLD